MKKFTFPEHKDWAKIMKRPSEKQQELQATVSEIFQSIQKQGDKAVHKYSKRYDKVSNACLAVSEAAIQNSDKHISVELQDAIKLAKQNIEKFHTSQKETPVIIETQEGVKCWRESRAIESVGIYIPGGSAPLFSTVLMLGIPAKLAGCHEIVLCTPPNKEGEINPVILFTAKLIGITKIYVVGGIQAIGALTFGTQTIPKVDKIFGPGNQYVTAAKQYAQNFGVAIDMPAGPSEVLVIADEQAVPEYVAADLLSQAEHGADSQVVLLSTNEAIVQQTLNEIKKQLKVLPRKDIAKKALKNSRAVILRDLHNCIKFSNAYAPEHLILAIKNYALILPKITNAGSVFLGNFSCESAGDYASGTNHTLPTNGYARNYSGVSLDSFVKKITFQELSEAGIRGIGPAIEIMAEAEQLFAHKNAVSVRLKKQ